MSSDGGPERKAVSGPTMDAAQMADAVMKLADGLDYVVIGGGNVEKLRTLPPKARRGDNANAFKGGFALWLKPEFQL